MMPRRKIFIVMLLVFAACTCSCVTVQERQQQEYGLLLSAVAFSADKVYGEYAESIPPDFNGNQFLLLVQGRIPDDYFGALQQYRIDVIPRGTYYQLAVLESDRVILFDFSCTKAVDGPVLQQPGQYDLTDLSVYDPCK